MIASLFALFVLAAQPAEPAETQVEAAVGVQAQTPVVDAEAEVEAESATRAPEEEIVCRRRLRPSERVGQRHRVVRDCRPRSEWQSARTRGN